MNFILHKHNKASNWFGVPDGLTDLLSDITREILRDQPANIYEYTAEYLEAMLIIREHAAIAQRTIDFITDISMTVSDLLASTGFPKEISFEIVGIVQTALEKCSINLRLRTSDRRESRDWRPQPINENVILSEIFEKYSFTPIEAIKIQTVIRACFKDYYFREKNFQMRLSRIPDVHWANRVEKTLSVYRESMPEKWQIERAAITIQAAYRGYHQRKQSDDFKLMNQQAQKIQAHVRGYLQRARLRRRASALRNIRLGRESKMSRMSTNFSILTMKSMNEEQAALKIQSTFRGYKIRKEISNKIDVALNIQL